MNEEKKNLENQNIEAEASEVSGAEAPAAENAEPMVEKGESAAENAEPAAENAEPMVENAESAAEETVPVKKGKKWVIPAAVAGVAVAAGAYLALTYVNPKDAVIDAFKSITAEGQTSPAEDIFGVQALADHAREKSMEESLGMTFEGSSLTGSEMLVGAGVDAIVCNDVENQRSSMEMGINFADMDLATIQLYVDGNQIMAAVPELVSRVFVLNYGEDLEGQLAASPYVGPMLEEGGIDLTGVEAYMDQYMELAEKSTEMFDLQALWTRYKEGSQAMDDLKEAMTAEKIEKKEFTIDGEAVNCKGYHVTLTKDALVQFLKTTRDFFLTDEMLKNDMITYMDMIVEMQNSLTAIAAEDEQVQSGEEIQQELWTDVETKVDEMIAWMEESMGDVSANVYVRKDGKMAGFDFDTTYMVEEENLKLNGDVAFAGGYNMLANVSAVLNREDEAGEVAVLTINKTGNYEAGAAVDGALTLAVDAADSDVTIAMDYAYQIADGSIDAFMEMLGDETSIVKLTANGFIENLVKGESFDCNLDSIRIESPELGAEDAYMEFSANYSIAPLSVAVEKPEGEEFDVLAGTEEDYNGIAEEIYGNLFGLIMQLYQ